MAFTLPKLNILLSVSKLHSQTFGSFCLTFVYLIEIVFSKRFLTSSLGLRVVSINETLTRALSVKLMDNLMEINLIRCYQKAF